MYGLHTPNLLTISVLYTPLLSTRSHIVIANIPNNRNLVDMTSYQPADPNGGRKYSSGKGLGDYDDAATPKASVKVSSSISTKQQLMH